MPPPLPAPATNVLVERKDSAMSGEGGVAIGGMDVQIDLDIKPDDLSVPVGAPVLVAIAHDVTW